MIMMIMYDRFLICCFFVYSYSMVGYGFFAVIWIHEKLEIFSESPGHQSCSCLQLRSAVYGCSIRTSEKPIQISTMYINTKV